MSQAPAALEQFRIDIQQLRAVAVIAVILNHLASDTFTGGYLGVDAFFVLSGYVITRSMTRSQGLEESGIRFFLRFWMRRIYRLWPSLFIVVAATMLVIWLLGLATASSVLTGVSSLLSISNFRLLLGLQDYFALSTNVDWFMHTWSLSVEEQFYLIISVVFTLLGIHRLHRGGERHLRTVVLLIAATSAGAALSLWQAMNPAVDELSRFYLPTTRFYQLAVGVLIALFGLVRTRNRTEQSSGFHRTWRAVNIAALIALIVLLLVELADERKSSLLVTAMTGLTIATSSSSTKQRGFVSLDLARKIGDRSYALYLVHWPVQVLSDLAIEPKLLQIPISAVGTVLLGESLHRLVETRWRLRFQMMSPLRSVAAPVVVLMGIIAPSLVLLERLEDRAQVFATASSSESCEILWAASDGGRAAALSSANWVIGDSHAEDLEPVISSVLGGDCVVVARQGPFFISERIASLNAPQRAIRARLGTPDELIGWIASAVPPPRSLTVTHYLAGLLADPATAPASSDFVAVEWLDATDTPISRGEFIDGFISTLERVAEAMRAVDGVVIVTSPPPDFNWLNSPLKGIDCDSGWIRPRVCVIYSSEASVSVDDHETRRRSFVEPLTQLQSRVDNVYHIDLSPPFCNQSGCSNYSNALPLYTDDDHLNDFGRATLEPLLQSRFAPLIPRTRPGTLFLNCIDDTTLFSCTYVRVNDSGSEVVPINFTAQVPNSKVATQRRHVDNFGNSYCITLYENGDATFDGEGC